MPSNLLGSARDDVSHLLFFSLPLLAWAGSWFALAGSPYLRPRSLYRHSGLVGSVVCWRILLDMGFGCFSRSIFMVTESQGLTT